MKMTIENRAQLSEALDKYHQLAYDYGYEVGSPTGTAEKRRQLIDWNHDFKRDLLDSFFPKPESPMLRALKSALAWNIQEAPKQTGPDYETTLSVLRQAIRAEELA